MVEVLMWEGDIDAAWHAAQHSGCTGPHWLKLARARGDKHPADAMPILRREVLAAIDDSKRPALRMPKISSVQVTRHVRIHG